MPMDRLQSEPSSSTHVLHVNGVRNGERSITSYDAQALSVRTIDLSQCENKSQLMRLFRDALSLPLYFGFNWDALEECLADLDWLEGDTLALMFVCRGELSVDNEELAILFSMLRSVGAQWDGEGRRKLLCVLIGDVPKAVFQAVAAAGLSVKPMGDESFNPHVATNA